MKQTLQRIIRMGREDAKPLYALTLKLMEETGELGEAVNHHLGHLPNKKMKEKIEGEVADVVQCAIATLAKAYPDRSVDVIYAILKDQLNAKTDKWQGVIDQQK